MSLRDASASILKRHLDAVVAVADLGVHAENALDVHRAFDVRFDRAQLDAAVLRDRGNAGGQTAGKADEQELDRRDALVLGREDLRVIGVERVRPLVRLFLAKAVELLDRGLGYACRSSRLTTPST